MNIHKMQFDSKLIQWTLSPTNFIQGLNDLVGAFFNGTMLIEF